MGHHRNRRSPRLGEGSVRSMCGKSKSPCRSTGRRAHGAIDKWPFESVRCSLPRLLPPSPTPPSPRPPPSPSPDVPEKCQECFEKECGSERSDARTCHQCLQKNLQSCAKDCVPTPIKTVAEWLCASEDEEEDIVV